VDYQKILDEFEEKERREKKARRRRGKKDSASMAPAANTAESTPAVASSSTAMVASTPLEGEAVATTPKDRKTKGIDPFEIVEALEEDNANDVYLYDVRQKNYLLTDYIILVTGEHSRKVYSLATNLVRWLRQKGLRINGRVPYIEKLPASKRDEVDWLSVDAGHTIVHVFSKEARSYYSFDNQLLGDPLDHPIKIANPKHTHTLHPTTTTEGSAEASPERAGAEAGEAAEGGLEFDLEAEDGQDELPATSLAHASSSGTEGTPRVPTTPASTTVRPVGPSPSTKQPSRSPARVRKGLPLNAAPAPAPVPLFAASECAAALVL